MMDPAATLADWLRLLEQRHSTAIDLGLDRCLAVWQSMGSPRPATRVITVAGTNGKGSTVATLCSLLASLGYRHGCYTTPHITRYNERIQIQGQPASDRAIIESFERVERARDDRPLSYFEFGTLAAIDLLARAKLDFAVLEVGLGGRLDAVNIIDADCAVITPVGLDHQEYLGDTRAEITREKAGILRAGIPVVSTDPEPDPVLQATAAELAAPFYLAGREFSLVAEDGQHYFRFGDTQLPIPSPVLMGGHQLVNLAGALAAVSVLLPEALVQTEKIDQGILGVRLAGRMQTLSGEPVIWLDVGHNPLAARALAATVKSAGLPDGRRVCRAVIGMLADKDVETVTEELSAVVDSWYCAPLDGDRGQSAEQLSSRLAAQTERPVFVAASVCDAISQVMAHSGDHDAILVFGSFFTVAEAMNHPVVTDRISAAQGKQDTAWTSL